MKRIILDQGLPATAAQFLRDRGWDAVHVREINMHADSDEDILVYAARESRVVITLDRDFPQIVAFLGAARPSIVLIRQQRLRAPALIAILTSIWNQYEPDLDGGCVVTCGMRGTRLRPLPIK
jgi:predicted nuclease of predicted toxin-antitoxin system